MPRISVIVPVYNSARYLRECFNSILAQTFTDWEVVAVDDGATDGSGAILDEYARADSRIRVLHKKNAGVWAARNDALEVATGEWVTYIDSDDAISRGWFFEAMRLAETSKADIVRLNYVFSKQLPSNFLSGEGMSDFRIFRGAKALEFGWSTFFPKGFLWMTFIHRPILGDLRFRTIRCKEDSLWLIELLPRVKSICDGDFVGYFYRNTTGSLSRGNRTYVQCITYLSALSEIWLAQKELAYKFGLQELLKCCIVGSAENDVIEWRRMCPYSELGFSRLIRREYCKLKAIGALPRHSPTKARYKLAVWWWRLSGQTWVFAFVEGLLDFIRFFRRRGNNK